MIYKIDDELRFGTNIQTYKKIPSGNWLVMQEEFSGNFFLKELEKFSLPDKIYGDLENCAYRYVHTFEKLSENVGVILTGLKGGGKSLTAEICAVNSKLPTLWVTQPFTGEGFQAFLSSIKQPCIILMNEFEKVYVEEKAQEQLLTILDGSFSTKFLFILTCNKLNINPYLKNRPSRIRYRKDFSGLDKETQQEIIDDCLEDKVYEKELKEILRMLGSVSTDVLMKFIEEINIYNEPPRTIVKHLNIQVEHSYFDVLMFINGKRRMTKINYNPLVSKYIYLSYKEENSRGDQINKWYERKTDDMDIQVTEQGEFEFKDRDGNKIIFTPSQPFQFSI